MNRLALGFNQLSVQWVPRVASVGYNVWSVKLRARLTVVTTLRIVDLYLHSPMRLIGMALN
jgi:hypothetical protein